MKKRIKGIIAVGLAAVMTCSIASAADAAELFEKFADVEQAEGPCTRWWVQDSSVTEEQIHEEMADIAASGYSAIEVCNKGGYNGGMGTDEWNQIVGWVLDACEENGLKPYFSYLNDSAVSLPEFSDTSVEGEQIITKLAHTERALSADDFTEEDGTLVFTGDVEIPDNVIFDFGGETVAEQAFVAVTAAKVTGGEHTYGKTASSFGDGADVIVQTTELDPDSLVRLDAVYEGETLEIDWSIPESENPEDYLIFVWFAQASGKNVNIFSQSGAQALVDYWKNTYYTERMQEYLENYPVHVFEDSIEISSEGDIVFTWSMLETMEEIREESGYDMLAYLPLAIGRSYAMNTAEAEAYGFAADENGNYADEQYWNEYTDILCSMFAENHVKYLSETFAEMNVTYRVQAYSGTNSNFYDVIESAAAANAAGGIAEGETLAFSLTNNGYDAWRYLSGGAHMGGGQLITNEYAAVMMGSWKMTFADMADIANKSAAGGANYFINHGYNSNYETEEWPGYHAFGDMFSEAWDDRDPSWENYSILTNYLSRLQTYAQTGTARLDLAVWYSGKTVMDPYFENFGLTDYGYSYEFINSTVLDSEQYPLAVVTDNILAQEGSAYQALILYNQMYLNISDMEILSEYAQEGLPVIFIGDLPSFSYTLGEALEDSDNYSGKLDDLLAQENVYTVEDDAEAAEALLASLNILPAASYSEPAALLNIHRQDEEGDYYWFYNTDQDAVSVTASLNGSGTPYLLDMWNGEISEITDYTEEDGRIAVSLSLEGLDTAAIAVMDEKQEVSGTAALAKEPVTETVDLTDAPWQLVITSYTQDEENPNSRTGLRTLSEEITLDEGLQPWLELDGMETVSGTGVYTVDFELDDWDGTQNAALVLDTYGSMGYSESSYWHDEGRIYYPDGTDGTSAILSVKVNGTDVGTVNQTTKTVSIGDYLQEGENTLGIEISSTLYNARYGEGAYEYGIESAKIEISGNADE